ncbi:hypothetical protein TWF481_001007 [Arthrobotrys musiformis]|uniref:Ribosome biogenesis protein Alb1 n=1 Tax=Arthrobotrys musiformis TaxID=47236 RepID=A0AAV9WRB7_9PEZI
MAKSRKAPSVHSRAARRAVSPSLNLDKSITKAPRPSSPTRTSLTTPTAEKITRKVLDVIHRTLSSGVQKSSTKQTLKRGQKSKTQKKRKEVGKEKAAAVAEILEVKQEESRKKSKVIKERSGDWENVNSKIGGGEGEIAAQVAVNPFAALAGSV